MESESVASPPGELLRFVPTLLTIIVLGGAAIVAMGGFKHRPAADATTAPQPVLPAPVHAAALPAVQPDMPQAAAEVLYIVDSPKVQEELEGSPILKHGSGPVSFSVLLVQTPEDELAARQTIAGIASELTAVGINFEVIDLRDSPPAAR